MKLFKVLTGVAFISFFLSGASSENVDPVIRNVVDHLKNDMTIVREYGAHQRVVLTKLNAAGTPQRVEEKTLRTIWVHNKQKNELVNVRCKEFDSRTGKSRRCYDVEQAAYKKAAQRDKDSKPGKIEAEIKKIQWTNLHKNFQFSLLAEEGPYHVIAFKPTTHPISPQNRIEKLLCNMSGKIWVDRQFKVVKAEAQLAKPVSFGMGVAAKVHRLNINYRQQPHGTIWLPAALNVEFHAKIALVHTERQRIEVTWNNPYKQSDTVWAQAATPDGVSSRR
jgi:hypothetical protein